MFEVGLYAREGPALKGSARSVGGRTLRLASRGPPESDPMRGVKDTVTDGVSEGRVGEIVVPMFRIDLAGDDRRA